MKASKIAPPTIPITTHEPRASFIFASLTDSNPRFDESRSMPMMGARA